MQLKCQNVSLYIVRSVNSYVSCMGQHWWSAFLSCPSDTSFHGDIDTHGYRATALHSIMGSTGRVAVNHAASKQLTAKMATTNLR